jgi:hypothetical protein
MELRARRNLRRVLHDDANPPSLKPLASSALISDTLFVGFYRRPHWGEGEARTKERTSANPTFECSELCSGVRLLWSGLARHSRLSEFLLAIRKEIGRLTYGEMRRPLTGRERGGCKLPILYSRRRFRREA